MKVGDLVKFESEAIDDMDRHSVTYGLIVQLSRTGHETTSAQVLFNDTGKPCWIDSDKLVVISESR